MSNAKPYKPADMIGLVLAITLETTPLPPLQTTSRADAQCVGSPAHLGTDNIPADGGKGTSIINMWVYQRPNRSNAEAWLYLTTGHALYIQYAAWPTNGVPQRVTHAQLERIDAEFAKSEVTRRKCFARDFVGAE